MSTQPLPIMSGSPGGEPVSNPSSGAPAPGGGGFFSRLGQIARKIAPYLPPATAHLAAAFGNYGPLVDLEQQQQRGFENSRQTALTQSTLKGQGLQQQAEQNQLDNYMTPQQKADFDLANQRKTLEQQRELSPPQDLPAIPGSPRMERVSDGKGGFVVHPVMAQQEVPNPALEPYQSSPETPKPNYVQDWGAGAPPTMPKTVMQSTPLVAPNKLTHGQPVSDGKGGFVVPVYDSQQRLVQMEPFGAGGVNGTPMSAAEMSPGKFKQSVDIASARGAAINATKPINALDNNGQSIITTFAKGVPGSEPGAPILSANQAGAAGVAQKRATFQEVDKNLANMRATLPAMDKLSVGDRAAIVAGLTPGKTALGQGIEGIGLARLNPQARSLVDAARNLKQGVLSLRNVLSSGGAGSDHRIAILEAEMPNEQDFAAGNSTQLSNKLKSFESIYNDIVKSYPTLFTQKQGASGGFANWKNSQSQAPPQ